jgi:hypothetical protein
MFRRFSVLLIVFGITTILASCQTAKDLYGSGPITLAPKVKEFVDKYTKEGQTNVIAVRTDGRYAYVSYCDALNCAGGGEEGEALYSCESKGGKCWIYAMNGYVVWKGPVTVAGRWGSTGGSGLKSRSDDNICFFAVDAKINPPKWDTLSKYKKYVDEANRRGLTINNCLMYVNIKKTAPEQPSSVSIPTKAKQPTNADTLEERLAQLKKLLDKGLITPDEAAEKRKKILNSL